MIMYSFACRACFKESLQLRRNEIFLSSPENFRRPFFESSVSYPNISEDLFLVICSIFTFQPLTNKSLQVQLHKKFLLTFLSSFNERFLNIFWFSPFFSTLALPNLQLQLHNCHFTTAHYILQLQKLSSVAR